MTFKMSSLGIGLAVSATAGIAAAQLADRPGLTFDGATTVCTSPLPAFDPEGRRIPMGHSVSDWEAC